MQYEISGFWRRVAAFFIDTVILGLFGLILGLLLYRNFVELGGWGRAVGFLIAAIYFVILNSRIGGGQTIGKKICKIQVIDKNGGLLSIPKSILRYSAIGIPYFLNGAMIPETVLYPVGIYIINILIFGFGLSIVYLIIFNRNTRQSLHDLITGTFVVRKEIASTDTLKPVWKVHYVICGIFMLLILLAPVWGRGLVPYELLAELTKTREEMQKVPGVVYTTIFDGKSTPLTSNTGLSATTFISSRVLINNTNVEDEKFASEIANIILETHKNANQKNIIRIIITYGYDIGIASSWRNCTFSYPPEHWRTIKN